MTTRLKDWMLCERCDVPVPVIHGVDGLQCGRCLRPYAKLRPLLVVEHRAGDHGLVTLREAAEIIRPKLNRRWLESIHRRHLANFPKPVLVVSTANHSLYDLEEIREWFEIYVRRPIHPNTKGTPHRIT